MVSPSYTIASLNDMVTFKCISNTPVRWLFNGKDTVDMEFTKGRQYMTDIYFLKVHVQNNNYQGIFTCQYYEEDYVIIYDYGRLLFIGKFYFVSQ